MANERVVKILGVDPGMARTGYGVISCSKNITEVVSYGCIVTAAQHSFAVRLKKIYDELSAVIDSHRPAEVAIEDVFLAKNAKLALSIGHARGVLLLLAIQRDLPTFEYSVREVKQAVTGNGTASKEQVQRMVCQILSLPGGRRNYDMTDALAVALCHRHRFRGVGIEPER